MTKYTYKFKTQDDKWYTVKGRTAAHAALYIFLYTQQKITGEFITAPSTEIRNIYNEVKL